MSKISLFSSFFTVCLSVCLLLVYSLSGFTFWHCFIVFVFIVVSFSARKMPVVRFKFTMLLSFITNFERSRWVCVESLLFTCLDVSLFAFCMFRPYTYHVLKKNCNGLICSPIRKGDFALGCIHWQFCTELTFCPTDVSFTGTFKSFTPVVGFHANSRLTWCGLILPTSSCFRCKQINIIRSKLWQSIIVTELIPLARGTKSPLKNRNKRHLLLHHSMQLTDATAVAFLVIYALEGVLTTIGNAFEMFVFWTQNLHYKRTCLILINVAVADLLVGTTELILIPTRNWSRKCKQTFEYYLQTRHL